MEENKQILGESVEKSMLFFDTLMDKCETKEEFDLCKGLIKVLLINPDKEITIKYDSGRPRLTFSSENGCIVMKSFLDSD
jgi:hypothetical protein